ncbi:MAG: 16S rRNA (uracil(1498)-N(3))-methyltransferase [Psychroflexus sp.]|uniref:16S rRNA (uracil(1498)-N(3))-methyltransferase n=1 Tax=Psychroflexus sp. S27 TaxID=1982757 RepID=UPI000C29C47C|nr:16S rRNA (uracil(1498)-N(3))-methyltransferase [Psychroflexus sp. S27]PJX20702.1 16S rRNA (uracil(1498)-N(3))-methyltransferase [Psychroflexus sp. S27]
MQFFYQPHFDKSNENIVFDPQESKHIVKVLRKKSGDILWITNGKGLAAKAELFQINQKKCEAKILEFDSQEKSKFHLHIAISPTKSNDRFETFLEKATEIGIHEITPLLTKNSERKKLNLERSERIVQSAMKQSLKYHLPKINALTSYDDFVKEEFSGQKCIAHCEDSDQKKFLFNAIDSHQDYRILIGPEGDFNLEEIKLAIQNNYQEISLSSERLRTETAAIVATHIVSLKQII